jgi:hypothetical protein
VRNKHIAIFVIALVAVAVLAWYQSLPPPHGPTSPDRALDRVRVDQKR